MLKVTIEINDRRIAEATAVNRGWPGTPGKDAPADRVYELHDGSTLVHNRNDGAVVLAKRILDRARMIS